MNEHDLHAFEEDTERFYGIPYDGENLPTAKYYLGSSNADKFAQQKRQPMDPVKGEFPVE